MSICHHSPTSGICSECFPAGRLTDMTPSLGAMTYTAISSFTGGNTAICPDLLRLSDLGAADNWRGRVVRGFFRLLRIITGI